jgi:hypothetical protein
MELIRKIIVGQNPKDAMAYFVGQKTGDAVVDSIVQDERALSVYGIRRYLVYIFNPDKGTMLWKTIDDMPCLIEHDCDF